MARPRKDKTPDLGELAKLFGLDPSLLSNPQVEEAQAEQKEHENQKDWRETLEPESVIFYMETKDREAIFKKKTCKRCNKTFLSTYTGVAYCTKECRIEVFKERGMPWNYSGRTEAERWGGTIPRVIGPAATEILMGMTFPDVEEPAPQIAPTQETSSPTSTSDMSDEEFDAFLYGDD